MTNIHIAELSKLLKENQIWAVTRGVLHLVVTLTQLEGTVTLLLFNPQTGTFAWLPMRSGRNIHLVTVQLRQTGTLVLILFNSDRQVYLPCNCSTQTDRYICLATAQLRQVHMPCYC